MSTTAINSERPNAQADALPPRRWLLLRAMLRQPLALVAGAFLLLIVGASILAPVLAPYSPTALDLANALSGPSAKHLLGSDDLGRDIFSRLLYGGPRALIGVLEGMLTAVLVAVPVGIIAGYAGGAFDRAVGAITDIVLAIPAIILVLVVLSIFPNNAHAAMIGFGLLVAPGFARIIRGVTLPLRESDFVSAARVAGVAEWRIMARHILPGVTRTAIVQASFVAANALLFSVALGYLGLTASVGEADWGQMVAAAAQLINRQPWLLAPSGGLIALTVLALTLFGNALRDANAAATSINSLTQEVSTVAPVVGAKAALSDHTCPIPDGALLAVRDLSVVFGSSGRDTLVVDKVSFDVMPGETVGLVGESGAGKSITALALLRLLPSMGRITTGQVFFEGRDIARLGDTEFDKLRGSSLGLISQEPLSSLDPAFTIGSQLAELVRLHDNITGTRLQARLVELLRQVQLRDQERVLRSYPHELSGGMAQRIAIAMALAGRPRLLIADEPTTALDVTVQKEILALLRQLQAETGMSVLLVTHNFGVVADSCERVIVMYAGQVFEEADVFDLFKRPLNPYSQGLLGANPAHAQPGVPLQVITGRVPAPGSWPGGCRFVPRCPYAAPQCQAGPIPLLQPAAGRLTRCIRVPELLEEKEL